jgi:serine protease AprX
LEVEPPLQKYITVHLNIQAIKNGRVKSERMEKKKIIILVAILVIALILIILLWLVLSEGGDNNYWFPGDENGTPSVKRTEWAFEDTQISDLNDDDYFGESVIIGIVDSGIDITHPDLDHINITAWADYVNNKPEPYDDNGHGTHIAGIIAAKGNIDGVAPEVKMVVVKAISSGGSGSDGDVAEGIDFCVNNGADVICLSLGGRARFLNLGDNTAQACEDAISEGVFVVAAAGNDGEDDDGEVASPATVDGVIAVGAIDENGKIAPFSSMGDNDGLLPNIPNPPDTDRQDPDKKPELVAPGVEIVSTWLDDGYAKANGTSQATAFVAGGMVLLLDANPQYQGGGSGGGSNTINQVKEVLMDTALEYTGQTTPHDDRYGYGLIQVRSADGNM